MDAVVPIAYSLAENSLVSTAAPVDVAHSLAAPRDAVVVTSVPPIAHDFALYPTSEALVSFVTASVVSLAQSCAFADWCRALYPAFPNESPIS